MSALTQYQALHDYEAVLDQYNTKPNLANNTVLYRFDHPSTHIACKYHNTYIVRVFASGDRIEFNTEGYTTSTTKARMQWFSPAGFGPYQRDGVWYVNGTPVGYGWTLVRNYHTNEWELER